MTVPNTARKAGPLLGTGAQTTWPFAFKVFAASDVLVTVGDGEGAETTLVLGTDYAVALNANQETSPGGTVTYPITGAPLPEGSVLAIVGDLDYDQPLDLPSGGNFSPQAIENQLDRMVMQIQQLREEITRTAKAPATAVVQDVDVINASLLTLAEISQSIETLAANLATLTAVAADLAEISAVADNIQSVIQVAQSRLEAVGDVFSTTRTITDPGYLLCDGRSLPKASYPALAAVLGTRPGIDTATAWTAHDTSIGDVYSCAYGMGLYVAVTASRITTSPDLKNWATRVSGVAPVAVAFGYQNGGSTGIFVAAGGGVGTLRYSLDGIAWTTLTGIGPTAFVDVIYANGVFVAVGISRIFTSVNGVTWTERSIPSGVSFSPQKVGYGLGKFVAVGSITPAGGSSVKQILVSDDAVTWEVRAVPQIGIVTSSVGIAFGGDTAVMTYGAHHALYSKDLVTWRKCHANFQGHDVSGESRVAFGHGLFLYTSRDTAFGYAAYSYDGVTWQDTTVTLENTVVNRVDFVNEKFIACANAGWVFESGLGYDPATHFAVPYASPGTGGLRTYIRT